MSDWTHNITGGAGGSVVLVQHLGNINAAGIRGRLTDPANRPAIIQLDPATAGIDGGTTVWSGAKPTLDAANLSNVTVNFLTGGVQHGMACRDRELYLGPNVENVILRGMRLYDSNVDGIRIEGKRILLEYCSIRWATDECLSIFGSAEEVVIRHCLISECLRNGGHAEGDHSRGVLITGGAAQITPSPKRVLLERNAFLLNERRAPKVVDAKEVTIHNNLAFGWTEHAWQFARGCTAAMLGNILVPNQETPAMDADGPLPRGYSTNLYQELDARVWYDGGNVREQADGTWRLVGRRDDPNDRPSWIPELLPDLSPQEILEHVWRWGARPLDAGDRRILTHLEQRGGASGIPSRSHGASIEFP